MKANLTETVRSLDTGEDPAIYALDLQGPPPPAYRVGERGLFLALLRDTLHCFVTLYGSRSAEKQLIWHEAKRWIMIDDYGQIPLSSVCQELSFITVAQVRKHCELWEAQRNARTKKIGADQRRLEATRRVPPSLGGKGDRDRR